MLFLLTHGYLTEKEVSSMSSQYQQCQVSEYCPGSKVLFFPLFRLSKMMERALCGTLCKAA